jgi:16S rRNA (guanine1516-N2)-methyltransferase
VSAADHESNKNLTMSVGVVCLDEQARPQAAELARRLEAPLEESPQTPHAAGGVVLEVSTGGVAARIPGDEQLGRVRLDFVAGALGYRLRRGVGRKLPLARAVGLGRSRAPAHGGSAGPLRVIDATLGLGRDAFLLGHLGCAVCGCERSAVLLELVRDALRRAAEAPELRAAAARLDLVQGDAVSLLQRQAAAAAPDVVYLDPMFPERRRESALVKKQMRLVHLLAGRHSPDEERALFDAALASGAPRIVVKRLGNAPGLAPGVHHRVTGKSVRYDVYESIGAVRAGPGGA